MKFAIVKEQRDFFNRNNQIEFDALLNPNQIDELQNAIHLGVAERLKTSPNLLYKSSPLAIFKSAHDVWRTNPVIQKLVTSKKLAEIASELVEYKPLRLGYDQYFPCDKARYSGGESYIDLLHPPLSLSERSCLDNVVCGVMLCLSGDNSESSSLDIFPSTPGNGIFFRPHAALDFSKLKENDFNRYLLIVYVEKSTGFFLNENDPHTHFMKQLGYVFGDRLLDKHHPLVYR